MNSIAQANTLPIKSTLLKQELKRIVANVTNFKSADVSSKNQQLNPDTARNLIAMDYNCFAVHSKCEDSVDWT